MCKSMKPNEKMPITDRRSYSTSHSSTLWFVGEIDGTMLIENFLPEDTAEHKMYKQIEAINLNLNNPHSSYKYTIEILQGTTYVIIRKDLACSFFRNFNSFKHLASVLGIPIEAAERIAYMEDQKEYLRLKMTQDLADEAEARYKQLTSNLEPEFSR